MTLESFRLGGFALRFRRSRSTKPLAGVQKGGHVPNSTVPLENAPLVPGRDLVPHHYGFVGLHSCLARGPRRVLNPSWVVLGRIRKLFGASNNNL
ncbi:hypothetical protein PpBr36_01207 [Pyricularia pennisetigena]|uniref:hypothetical protein n=1 Tax=Pyricularia pennisetigena TaxID=1578925 RepID=UPI0011531541|nr:hypothetical protein PpBr36_01207 [Pyricularia pennisetigena]TLS27741.1 hypothetical protein PpBr36_01207 [Pyricularia pennisetigena]